MSLGIFPVRCLRRIRIAKHSAMHSHKCIRASLVAVDTGKMQRGQYSVYGRCCMHLPLLISLTKGVEKELFSLEFPVAPFQSAATMLSMPYDPHIPLYTMQNPRRNTVYRSSSNPFVLAPLEPRSPVINCGDSLSRKKRHGVMKRQHDFLLLFSSSFPLTESTPMAFSLPPVYPEASENHHIHNLIQLFFYTIFSRYGIRPKRPARPASRTSLSPSNLFPSSDRLIRFRDFFFFFFF